jgi:hypothetical protein
LCRVGALLVRAVSPVACRAQGGADADRIAHAQSQPETKKMEYTAAVILTTKKPGDRLAKQNERKKQAKEETSLETG